MKKLTLAVAGLLIAGMTSAMADGSKVQVNKNVMLQKINKSKIDNSTLGMKVTSSNSKVQANKNVMLQKINKSKVKNSTLGVEINAK